MITAVIGLRLLLDITAIAAFMLKGQTGWGFVFIGLAIADAATLSMVSRGP